MQARGRAATLRELQDFFGTLKLDHIDSEFQRLMDDAERSGLILTFAALVGDGRRCHDKHSKLAHEWARRAVDALGPVDSAAGHRWLQQERARVEGLVAVLDALVAREAGGNGGPAGLQAETAAPRDAGVRQLVQLRQRANMQLLRLRLLAAIPEKWRKPESEHRICESLARREQELRKIGLPLLHDKLAEVFVPTPLAAKQRGIGHSIAALVERLHLTRQKWTDAQNRGDGVGGDELAPEFDPEQIEQEVDIERAARISLLYATALHCNPDAPGAVEQQVDKVRCALGGTSSDLAVALALFWLDAVDAPYRLHRASLFLCRPGVAGVLGSLRVSPWCHRFLTQPALSGADEPDIVWSGLEACQLLQQYDSGFLTVQDIAEYSVALLAWSQNPEALGQTLEAASQRLALATRLALDCPLSSCGDETLAQIEHELLLSFTAGGVGQDVLGVAVSWCASQQGLWLELMTPRLMATRGGERDEEMPDSGVSKFALFKPQVLVKVRLSSHEAVPAVRAHLEKLAKNPLSVTAGHPGGVGGGARCGAIEVVSTYVSDGSSSIHDWRQLLHVVMSAMLAAMPDSSAALGEQQEAEPLPAFAAPLHTLVGKHMSHAVEIALGAFLRAPLPHIQQLRKTMLQSMGLFGPHLLKQVLDIAEERARQGAQQEVLILRALLFRRYGQAVTHLEQQWQQKNHMGNMASHVSCALGHTPGAIGRGIADNLPASAGLPSAALPFVQVYMAQAQAAISWQGHGAGGSSWDEAQVPESPLFAGTPILSQRRGFVPPPPPVSANAQPRQHSKFSITPHLTPHRLVAQQSIAQTRMLVQPSPFVAPWIRGGGGGGGLGGFGGEGGATPSSWGTPMQQTRGTHALTPAGHQSAVEMDEDVTFGHGRSRALGSSLFALTNSPSPAPTPTRFGIYIHMYM
jgi:hypothetical protein